MASNGDMNRGPVDCPLDLVSDGPHEPKPPKPDKPVSIGLAEALRRLEYLKREHEETGRQIAILEMKIHELNRRFSEGEK